MKAARGFTLIELMVAAAIMMIAMIVAGSIIMAGVNFTRTATQRGDVADQARMGMDELVKSVTNAANGAPQGLYVSIGGTPTLIGAVFGMDGTAGNGGTPAAAVAPPTDDLWVVVPVPGALRDPYDATNHGAATTVMKSGTGPLAVGSVAGFATGDMVMATNMTRGALLSINAAPTAAASPQVPATLNYAESGTGISDSPERGGFQVGDMVYQVHVFHYFVMNDATGMPGLYRTSGVLSGTGMTGTYPAGPYPRAGRPFLDDPNSLTLIQRGVDDLQVKYFFDTAGTGDPTNFASADGLGFAAPASPGGTNATTLRAVRITLEVRSDSARRNTDGQSMLTADTRHGIIENNYTLGTQPVADGFLRTRYTRTIELPNTSPGSL